MDKRETIRKLASADSRFQLYYDCYSYDIETGLDELLYLNKMLEHNKKVQQAIKQLIELTKENNNG